MKEFNEIYEINKILDAKFTKECKISKEEMNLKNILELLIELGEFANETRCFKYWSCKGSSPKKVVLDEYSDCLMMILYFADVLDLSLDEKFPEPQENDVVTQFIYLYNESSKLKDDLSKDRVKLIFSNLIKLGHDLGYTNEDIIDAFKKKFDKNIERFKTNFSY